jgi:hypothetical protein
MSQTWLEKLAWVAMILYQQAISDKISRLLTKYNPKTIDIPVRKNIHIL